MSYQVGDTLGKYTVCGELGHGGFGTVYLVEWQSSKGKRQGALKILTQNPSMRDILEEVSTWARVSHHPNILTFIGATEYNQQILLISECATGGSLADWINAHAGQQATVVHAVRLLLEVLLGLAHLHDNGIVHRDIKPANILLQNDTPLLADFGLARGLDLVQSSILGGTLAYMSPELINVYFSRAMGTQATYERTEADDLWAAAVTLYQMLANDYPFSAINDIIVASPAPLPAHVPPELRDFVAKSLQKEPARRFSTVQEMRIALEQAWAAFQQRVKQETIKEQARQEQERLRREAEQAQEQRGAEELKRQRGIEEIHHVQEIELNRQKQNAQNYNNRGLAYNNEGNFDQAINAYNMAIKLNPKYAYTYNNRGLAYHNKGNYDQAIKDYNKAFELNPQYVNAYNNRGSAYYFKGNYHQAINDFSKAIELNPQYANAYNNRGLAYEKLGEMAKAQADRRKYEELSKQK